jgi:hypothetical protein
LLEGYRCSEMSPVVAVNVPDVAGRGGGVYRRAGCRSRLRRHDRARRGGRGERLVAFFTHSMMTAYELWDRLCHTELPRLWLPKREDLHPIASIPTLGSGKIELRRVRALALEQSAPGAS